MKSKNREDRGRGVKGKQISAPLIIKGGIE